jgi:hypothetical protein
MRGRRTHEKKLTDCKIGGVSKLRILAPPNPTTRWEGIMKGSLYRLGVRIKDFGERMARVPVLRFFAPWIRNLGLAIRNRVLKMSVKGR